MDDVRRDEVYKLTAGRHSRGNGRERRLRGDIGMTMRAFTGSEIVQ